MRYYTANRKNKEIFCTILIANIIILCGCFMSKPSIINNGNTIIFDRVAFNRAEIYPFIYYFIVQQNELGKWELAEISHRYKDVDLTKGQERLVYNEKKKCLGPAFDEERISTGKQFSKGTIYICEENLINIYNPCESKIMRTHRSIDGALGFKKVINEEEFDKIIKNTGMIDLAKNYSEMLFEKITYLKDPDDMCTYIKIYPQGKNIYEVRSLYEPILWGRSESEGTIKSLTKYLEIYPYGKYSGEAKYKIEEIKLAIINAKEKKEKAFEGKARSFIGRYVSWKEIIQIESCVPGLTCHPVVTAFKFRGKVIDLDMQENKFVIEIVDTEYCLKENNQNTEYYDLRFTYKTNVNDYILSINGKKRTVSYQNIIGQKQ